MVLPGPIKSTDFVAILLLTGKRRDLGFSAAEIDRLFEVVLGSNLNNGARDDIGRVFLIVV